MRRAAAVFSLAVAMFLSAEASAARLVYRVDSVSAKIVRHRLVVKATGAVSSGGWTHAHLRAMRTDLAEPGVMVVEFLATPPARRETVIQASLPVDAKFVLPLPRYAETRVKVVAKSNSLTAAITR